MVFVGIKNNKIKLVSDTKFNNDLKIIELKDFKGNINNIITDYKVINDQVVPRINKPIKRVAFVNNWKMQCGIATYVESLYKELLPLVPDYKLFVEENPNPTGPINCAIDYPIPEDKIISCWKRGESLQNLVNQIKQYNPDVILISHEFGLFPNARYWLSFITQLQEFRIITTMHSVFHHKDKTICEAAIPEIIVHLDGAINVLKDEKHIPGKVYKIPHGCDPCIDNTKLWNFYKSNARFMQMGFAFRYKGFEKSILATNILKEKYPDVFFTAILSESVGNKSEHQLYFNDLMELIEKYNLQDNVALLKGFQSDQTLDSYIRTNLVSVFPYVSNPEHEVFGSSGAGRLAMSKGIPVISSSIPHFSDLPSIKADSPEDIAKQLDLLFSDWKLREAQIKKQNEFLELNSWKNIALKHLEIFNK